MSFSAVLLLTACTDTDELASVSGTEAAAESIIRVGGIAADELTAQTRAVRSEQTRNILTGKTPTRAGEDEPVDETTVERTDAENVEWLRQQSKLRKLNELMKTVKTLQKEIADLKKKE